MTMAPTLEGGLRIDADSLSDWMILELICADATNLPGPPLYDHISSRMEQNDDWKEFVVPDIVTQFDEQVTFVSREKQYDLSKIDEIENEKDLDALDNDTRAAVIRNHFYTSIQSLLLEFVM